MQFRDGYFLNVAESVSGKAWTDRLDIAAARTATAISQQTGLSEIVARIMAGRGIAIDQATSFLDPTIRDLMPDPSTLTAMDDTAARLADAIIAGESIALFGDYDVDGACSCALMTRFLSAFGITPQVHIPDRIFEGYGPNVAAMDTLIDGGASLIITLDCGTTSEEPIAHARKRGADVLVIDHHLADHDLPPANALVNPNRPDDVSGLGYLCAAGVTFMTMVATNRTLRQRGQGGLPDLMGLVDLVALATVCDVVPLTGLNRAFVRRGLEIMRQGGNKGISALALAARASGPLSPYHLGFLIGPRINAGGRIGDAALGARLLSSGDDAETMAIAARLDELNTERQRIEIEAVEEAIATAEAEIGAGEGPPVLVLASENWHPGVVGLVASRLKDRFDRPAFAIAIAPNGKGTGSGRSLPGVDLGTAVIAAVDAGILPKGGGHAMAAGITVEPGKISAFRAFLTDALSEDVAKARARVSLSVDAAITARGASVDFVHLIEKAGPFGAGNPTPIFAFPGHKVKFADVVGKGGHIRFTLVSADGARLKGIAFRAAGTPLGQLLLDARDDRPLHVCGTIGIDHWQGREQVQIRLIDAAQP
ncbi:single-stranded-DNA-specific exonuclease RecJ [Mariluticola halotolerans]|uniref:single-stranded-DNA-specific exonuclease RecJ n=1 Tax=Mariluticola halotolerans TaxID=2909283 RepID=UPI0026E15E93|nr:single-stranded-DNA-specific exonuclease RecJ [Mariluticola halotolerans]UJQ95618.1 single-stranded-DNA-specific exonuclease RecJ [Mariluticola halotolerans]